MQKISEDIFLIKINLDDHDKLYGLMFRIYPPVYEHLWLDKGKWYLNKLYSKDNLEKELDNPNSQYYFVLYKREVVGILRVLLNEYLDGINNMNSIKLQRIYLDSTVQGKGLGKKIINWLEKEFKTKEKSILWLEVMDTQNIAISFYENLGFEIFDKFRFQSKLMIENMKGMYKMSKEI